MDLLTSLLNSKFNGHIDKIEFKAGAFGKSSKAFTVVNPEMYIDDESTIIIKNDEHIVNIPYGNNIVHWDYENGIKHIIDIGYKNIGIAYTKENIC